MNKTLKKTLVIALAAVVFALAGPLVLELALGVDGLSVIEAAYFFG